MIDGQLSGELESLHNDIDGGLKELLDRAVSGSDHDQRTVLSAMIHRGLDLEEGLVSVDENLEELVEEYEEHYYCDGEDSGDGEE